MVQYGDFLNTPSGYATPEQIKRAQEYAYVLLKQPEKEKYTSWTQGARDVLNALIGRKIIENTTKADYLQRQQAGDVQSQLLNQIQGQGGQSLITTGALPPQISTPQQAAVPTPQQTASLPINEPQRVPPLIPKSGPSIISPTDNQVEAPKEGFKLDNYIKRLFEIESGNNPAARKGSYRGLAQFSPDLEKKYNITDENWQDPTSQINAAARHSIENAQAFKKRFGYDPSPGQLYLMHQQGTTGGIALMGSSPNAPAYKTLAEASGASEDTAKSRVFSNIPKGNPLALRPVSQITNDEFTKLWTNKFEEPGGFEGKTVNNTFKPSMLGGPKEGEISPTGLQGQQIAQATEIPPAVKAPSGLVNQDVLARVLADPRIPDEQKAMIQEMMIQGATPAARDTAIGKQEFRPSSPGETSTPGATATGQISLHGITIPTIMTRLPSGQMVNQFLLPNGKLSDAEGLMEWSRKQGALDVRESGMATKYYEREQDIQQRAEGASRNKQMLSIARALSNDPAFYSGTGANKLLDYTKIAAYVTGNPNWSGSPEAFSKVMAGANIAGLEAFKGYGQIRNPEIELLQRSQGDINNTPGAIQAIITMNEKASERLEEIGIKMRDYRKIHKRIDEGFDDEMARFYKDRPLFTDEEIKNYRKVLFGGKETTPEKKIEPITQPKRKVYVPGRGIIEQ